MHGLSACAGGDLVFDFCKGPRDNSLPERVRRGYIDTIIDMLATDIDVARTLLVRPNRCHVIATSITHVAVPRLCRMDWLSFHLICPIKSVYDARCINCQHSHRDLEHLHGGDGCIVDS